MSNLSFRRAILATALGTASGSSLGAGFYLQESGVAGLGRGFAAENTVGDNAAILARNPAGSALFDYTAISLGLIHVDPEIDAEGDVTFFVPNGPAITVQDEAKDYGTSAWVPNAYIALPFNERWSGGFAMYTSFGLETDFDDDFLVSHISNRTELISVNLAPSVAYRINEQFSIGASIKALYAEGTIQSSVPENLGLAPSLSGLRILDLEGDTWEFGWSVGALWQPNAATRVGISYHSELKPEIDGKINSDLLPDLTTGMPLRGASGEMELGLPDTLELGLYHRLTAHWGLVAGIMWTDWGDFQDLEAYLPGQAQAPGGELYNPLLLKEEGFDSALRYSIGVEHYLGNLTLRAGYVYDEGGARDGLNRAATEEVGLDVTWRTLSIPDTDRQWLTVGGSYHFGEHLSVDGGVAFLWGDDETVQEFTDVPLPTYFDGGTTKTEALLIGVSVNYRF
jgi:long-chain fatty acid transport protein